MRVLIVAEHASARFGGEAALPLHYFRVMRARGVDVRMITHARVRDELREAFPDAGDRIAYIEDTATHRLMWRLGQLLPARLAYISTGFVSRVATQRSQRRLARGLVRRHGIDVVHQPMPVSPREPSLMHGLGAPVIIGPLNGNMTYPPAFRTSSERRIAFVEGVGRRFSETLNALMPGKRRAAAVVVANERTREALPRRLSGQVVCIPENGVDLGLWREQGDAPDTAEATSTVTRFAYMGRLVDWKAVDLLLVAFERARAGSPMTLTLFGDGVERPALTALARRLGILGDAPGLAGTVFFAGWRSQAECALALRESDALVLPSLWECGGAVVLEAMACTLPVIATAWGGPLDYIDASTGILVPPVSRHALVDGLTDGMRRLAASPDLRRRLGAAGRRRIETEFDWERKMDAMWALYERVANPQPAA
jgi:glycosyltransferase involved in cell wall biosynthesis